MPRFFTDPSNIDGSEIKITGSDVNHIKNVLRMRAGEEISVSDGAGKDYFGKIRSIDRDCVLIDIENSWDSYVELPAEITLFQGLPKADKMELIIQKAVELGACAIVPVITKRTIVRWDEKKQDKKLARWQGIAESAAKQSGRGIIPKVTAPVSFSAALAQARFMEAAVIPYEKAEGMEAAREKVRSMRGKKSIGVFIGPEGGFDTDEIEAAIKAGVCSITLGRRILRTETAGLTALSILMFELDE
ncbi:MAG TPA: 16S rRNA (uracil(1498)-N(3))-methyltransferase [Candidatus Scybalocola faecipullorum]|nr:16S rRNA (uracil(1498)-N(3))-methyltransferase [Candidatus Scybalocola faecipullorum]